MTGTEQSSPSSMKLSGFVYVLHTSVGVALYVPSIGVSPRKLPPTVPSALKRNIVPLSETSCFPTSASTEEAGACDVVVVSQAASSRAERAIAVLIVQKSLGR